MDNMVARLKSLEAHVRQQRPLYSLMTDHPWMEDAMFNCSWSNLKTSLHLSSVTCHSKQAVLYGIG